MSRKCANCSTPLPGDKPGRGGKQPSRKYCSQKCKDATNNAKKKVKNTFYCEKCGKPREITTKGYKPGMCRTCAAEIATEAARAVTTRPPLERFMEKVSIQGPDGHWEWTGYIQPNGYGTFYASGRVLRAHRWSYEHFVGEIPEGLHIDHLCRVRHCVNPEHLEPVTREENYRRALEARNGAK